MDEPVGDGRAQIPAGLSGRLRALMHKAVPSHFNDPFGLALRILRSGSPDARAALIQAGLRLGLAPVDLALALFGSARPDDAEGPSHPVLFVTGPPRSGTTLMHQILIRSLPVGYVTNLASLLPRSAAAGAFPLAAAIANRKVRLDSYYGRTRSLSGPSDGLEFWDRWLGADRRAIPAELLPGADRAMRCFFRRLERRSGRPVVAKNNGLLGSAHLVAAALPTARFICLRRDPLYLAQSLLKARRDIHGTSDISYGIEDRGDPAAVLPDPVEDVWRQVRFYEELAAAQQARLGEDRFMILSYEALCENPAAVAQRLARTVFDFRDPVGELPPLRPRKQRSLDPGAFALLERKRGASPSAKERGGADQR